MNSLMNQALAKLFFVLLCAAGLTTQARLSTVQQGTGKPLR
jgi:hypothetical protein